MAFKAFTSIPASQITVPTQPSRTPLLSTYYFPSSSFGPVFGDKDSDSILHSVAKIQPSSTWFPVLRTCIYFCFIEGSTLCRIKKMDNSMKPRETILYNNWKKNKCVFHKKEGKTRVFQCHQAHRNSISCSLPTSITKLPKWWRKKAKDLWLPPLESMTICFSQEHER